MNNIKVLDCTLRDGGYVNNWSFGSYNIISIINNLTAANVNIIECGFLKENSFNKESSLFDSPDSLESYLPTNSSALYSLMINYGEIALDKIPKSTVQNLVLRIVFKKEKRFEALDFCNEIKKKGYNIFINPMQTSDYSTSELLELIEAVNSIKPLAFTIVDSNGLMKKRDVLSFFYLADNNLNKDIWLGFHSHNNMQLSFSNAQIVLEQNTERTLIIDSTVFGMGRGAGNLCTELLTQYINDNYEGNYNIVPILKIIDEQINPIFAETPWGYSVPYYLASINRCHPNYAKYLVDKKEVPVEKINTLLQAIPENRKSCYDAELIEKIYLKLFLD